MLKFIYVDECIDDVISSEKLRMWIVSEENSRPRRRRILVDVD